MARSARPNKCWRVLHRVTSVERPALLAVGRRGSAGKHDAVSTGFAALNRRLEALDEARYPPYRGPKTNADPSPGNATAVPEVWLGAHPCRGRRSERR